MSPPSVSHAQSAGAVDGEDSPCPRAEYRTTFAPISIAPASSSVDDGPSMSPSPTVFFAQKLHSMSSSSPSSELHRPCPHTTSAFEPVASPYWRVSRLTPSRISTNDDDDVVAMVGAPEVMMISQRQTRPWSSQRATRKNVQ